MKPIIPFALLCAFLASGTHAATTTPVGYETLSLTPSAFNYLGLRLHQPVVASGNFTTVGASSVQDEGADFSAISANASTLYIIEIVNAAGVITEITGASVAGDTITTVDDLSAAGVANDAAYTIRPAATLDSVFGAANEAGLAAGFFGPGGADVVYLPDGAGGFDQYYYDSGFGSWADATAVAAVVGAEIGIVYADGVVISASATAPSSIVVSGEVKTGATQLMLLGGFNYTSPVAPAGATLVSTFTPSDLNQGFFGPGGSDVVYVPNGTGFDQYYYDSGFASWANVATVAAIDGATIDLPAGIIVSNSGGGKVLTAGVPTFYNTL